jgi:hypothetical protein
MILYSNLSRVKINGIEMKSQAILNLTSSKLTGCINSNSNRDELEYFLKQNNISKNQINFIEKLFKESKDNSFVVSVQYSK